MTIERLSNEAVLELGIIANGIDELIAKAHETTNGIDGMGRSMRALDGHADKVTSTLRKMAGQTETVSSDLRASTKAVTEGSDKWQKYTADLAAASAAYRQFRQGQITGEGGGKNLNDFDPGALAKYAAMEKAEQSLVSAARERQSLEEKQLAEVEGGMKRLLAIQGQRANEVEKETARYYDLQQAVQHRLATERDVSEELERQARLAANQSAIRASNSAFMGNVDSRVGYQPVGPPAASTGLADILRREEAKALALSGRDYANASTIQDQAIRDRERTSKTFSDQLRAQMQAEVDLAKAIENGTDSIISARYALYDVSTTLGIASAAMLAVTVSASAMAISYESSFTDVQRTTLATGASLENIRGQLLGLAREIPLAFSDITTIASLGAQLGIAQGDLAGFTQTVAQFSAATNVSVEESATAFGALGELLDVSASQYANLGSSITLVGVNSVATESEILAVAQQIASYTALAGMSADETIGLSGALASLRVPPEQARSAIQSLFTTLNEATAEGGDKLDNFAHVLGMTAEQTRDLVKTNPGAFIDQFASSLATLDSEQLTLTLDALELSEKRVATVLTKLASNTNVLDTSMSDSSEGFANGAFLAEIYATRVEDIASKLQILTNGVAELGATAGAALTPVLGPLIDGLTGAVNFMSDLLATDAGQWFAGVGLGATAVVGSLLALAAAGALGTASLFALNTAVKGLGWSAAGTGATSFIAGLVGVGTASAGTTAALGVFKVALVSTGIGAAVVLLGTLAAAFMQAGDSATAAFDTYIGSTAGLADAMAADQAAYSEAVSTGNAALASSFDQVSIVADTNSAAMDENAQTIANTASVLGLLPEGFSMASGAIDGNTAALGANTTAWLKNQLMQNEAFQQLAGNAEFTDYWAAIGANMDDVIRASASGGQQAVSDYFAALEAQAKVSGAKFQSVFNASGAITGTDITKGGIGNLIFGGSAGRVGDSVNSISKALTGYNGQIKLLGLESTKAGKGVKQVDDAALGADRALNKAGKAAESTAKKVRTLVDYANDLSGVFKRAFDIRFSGQQGLDTINSGWSAIAKATADANEKIAEYQRTMSSLTADKAIKEYWLSVAENYGDALRAGKLRAELADIDADLAKNAKGLTEEQAKSSKTLEGNSDAAIANRAEILGLVGNYQDYITKLAASGMSQAELQATSARLKQEFIAQATQLGYSGAAVQTYAKAFDDVSIAIAKVPRNITVSANTNPALQALNEFEARARAMGGNVYSGGTISAPTRDAAGDAKAARLVALEGQIGRAHLTYQRALASGADNTTQRALDEWQRLVNIRASGSYASGGYTGDGGKYEPKGIVHGGEFVFSKAATSRIGVENLAYAHNMAKSGMMPRSSAASTPSGPMVVELSPYDRQLLADAGNLQVVIPGAMVAKAVSTNNVNGSNRGNG